MSLAKIPAILLLGIGIHVSTTPPNPATVEGKRRLRDGPVDVHISTFILKIVYWAHAFIETVVIVGAHCCPQSIHYKQMVHYLLPHGNKDDIFLSPATAVAAMLGVLVGIIRYLSFRELGRHFTFHVTILKDHKLITTGPYGLVRHPGYLGVLLLYPIMLVYYMAPGSWMRESQVYARKESWCVLFPVLTAASALFVDVVYRLNAEDDMLKREFGKEWENWASRVRYKTIPGIY